MNASNVQHRMTQEQVPQGPGSSSLAMSIGIHVLIIVLAIVGLPHFTKPNEIISTPVPIEIVPIGEVTTTNKPPVEAPKPKEPPKEEPKPAPPKEVKKAPSPPKVEAKDPPKPKPPEPPKEKPKPAEKPAPKVPPPDAQTLEKPEEKPVEKPPEPQVQQEDNQEAFDSLLRNLQDSEPAVTSDSPAVDAPAEPPIPSPIGDFSKQLLVSEADALRQQLSQCWSIQAGGKYAENLVVEVRLIVNRDRTVQSATITDQYRYNSDPAFRAAADSAVRAVRSPMCTPLRLPPEKYEGWKDTIVNFDPKDML